MLSMSLRISLIIVAIVFIVIVINNVGRKKLLLQYSLSWLIIAVGMIMFAVFPKIAVMLSKAVNVKEPSNFVYAVGLLILLYLLLGLTRRVSKQNAEMRNLVQYNAINRFLSDKKDK